MTNDNELLFDFVDQVQQDKLTESEFVDLYDTFKSEVNEDENNDKADRIYTIFYKLDKADPFEKCYVFGRDYEDVKKSVCNYFPENKVIFWPMNPLTFDDIESWILSHKHVKELVIPYNPDGSEQLDEKYSKEELDDFIDQTFNQRKIIRIYRSRKYGSPELIAKTRCVKCEDEKNVLLSNLINDPEKYGSCKCSDTNIESKVKEINKLYAGKKKIASNTSGYTGVYHVKDPKDKKSAGKWRAYIDLDGHRVYLGDFVNKSKAIEARKEAALHGISYYRKNMSKIKNNKRSNIKAKDIDAEKELGLDKE